MPMIFFAEGRVVLQCANHSALFAPHNAAMVNDTTMRAQEGYHAFVRAVPPRSASLLPERRGNLLSFEAASPHARIDVTGGEPVKLFVCSVCGYTEVYHATIAAPDVWKEP